MGVVLSGRWLGVLVLPLQSHLWGLIVMSVQPYKPVEAFADDLPMGYLMIADKLQFIIGSALKFGRVLIVTDNPTKVLGDVTYANPTDLITVWVPADLNDPEVYSNLAYHVSQLGIDITEVEL